jgi:two-component system sensor histidine kinase HydH
VAHEVRNPLAGIRSTVQLWQRGIGRDAETVEDLLSEVDRLDGIVGRLLHFSRADIVERNPGDPNTLASEAARLASVSAEDHGVAIQLELAPNLPFVMMAAPALIQVLRNLTTNAIQAMPDGGVLGISTRSDPTNRMVEIEVSDTGLGLSPEAASHLFEPFFTTKPSGTGLGLAIAREIALAHHGELKAGPRPDGPGASFRLSLPVAAKVEASRRFAHADRA